jgi:DNA-binding NtrC family response regulator
VPAPDEVAQLRRRIDVGIDLLRKGRHARGGRVLRQTVGALARRDDWQHASRGGIALAEALVSRGRLQEAEAVLSDASMHASRVGGPPSLLVEAAVLLGVVALERTRLDEAESLLQGAVAVARAGRASGLDGSRLALARCLFWRGRYGEAHDTVAALEAHGETSSCDSPSNDPAASIRIGILKSRIAVGRADLAAGVSQATRALHMSERLGEAVLIAESAYATAFARLAVGDLGAVHADVQRAVATARAVQDPVRGLKARLIGIEALRRSSTAGGPPRLLRRWKKLRHAQLPATVRARVDLLLDLFERPGAEGEIVLHHTAVTGLHALRLFVPVRPAAEWTEAAPIEDTLELLQCCQQADDERTVLNRLCNLLRRQLGAATVAFVSVDGGVLASDGRRLEHGTAKRVLDACQPLPPHLHDGCIEGGAPVRYAGETLAALVASWTIGVTCDQARAARVLTIASAIAAPGVAEIVARLKQATPHGVDGILGRSGVIEEVRRAIERAATSPFPVLIQGESGSGKELVAKSLHRSSPRRARPFCCVNCAALPDDLVESELFGHTRGAFTGAGQDRPGLFEEAHTGTLFLDEIGELSGRAQAKLLRTLQEGEVRRVGENVPRRIDVRIVAASNRDLSEEVASGRFRRDLLYRLDVVRIVVPPLRERRDDIALLAARFWAEATSSIGSRATLSATTIAALMRYDWPGNVRELQNVLAALAVRSPKRGIVAPAALPQAFGGGAALAMSCRLDAARRMFEERFVRAALVRTGGHRTQAAQELGVTRQGLTKLMARLGIANQQVEEV